LSEVFQFSTVWKELDPAGIERDYLTVHTFDVYSTALEQHRRACEGRWVEGHLWPEVTSLVGMVQGRAREIRCGVPLWKDDRPPLTRVQFTELRKKAFGRMAERDLAA
jgi:hypothetical protein